MRSPDGGRIVIMAQVAQMFLTRRRDHMIEESKALPGSSPCGAISDSKTRNGPDSEHEDA